MIGKGVKAAAENSDLARLSGINPKLVSLLVWTIGGFLATLSMILIAGQANSSGTLAALGPSTLVRALAAAVIGGMVSFPIALVAGIGHRNHRSRRALQFPRRRRPHRLPALPRRARRGLAPEPTAR